MKRSRLAPFALTLAALTAAAAARAGIPCASSSTVDPAVVVCPAGDVVFTVVSRHCDTSPWAEGPVSLGFCGCPGFHLGSRSSPYSIDSDGCTVYETPIHDGTSRFPIAAGGVCASSVRVYGDGIGSGVPLGDRPVASLDQDGDLVVTNADIAIIQSKVGTHDLTADFDADGTVTAADVAFAQNHLGHGVATGVPYGPAATTGMRFSRPPWPNPARGAVTFVIATPDVRSAEITVNDLTGRRVATLWSGPLAAGEHPFTWKGRTAQGETARAGLYLVQLRGGDVAVAKLFTLLR